MHGVSIDKVRYLLQTHAHSDHFDGGHIQTRIPEYVVEGIEPLPIYASQGTLTKMSHQLRELGYVKDLFDVDELKRINCSIVSLTTSALVTAGAYNILPVSSNHDVGEESLVFAIRNEGNSIFYGTDTDELSSVSLTALVECGWKYDIVILDHTYGWDIDGGGHLNGNKFVAIMDFMNKNQLVNDDTRFFATHISHEGNPPHEAFNKIAAKYGYEAAYDGLQIEI